MSVWDWIAGLRERRPHRHDDEVHVRLDDAEGRIAGRLSRLTGKRRDEVLAESYRRADKILAGKAAGKRK